MTDEAFMKLVDAGIDSIPRIDEWLKNVAIVVEDEPPAHIRAELEMEPAEIIFGLYEGVPQSERGAGDDIVLPDKITIYKNHILAAYSDPDDIAACVANTVWHEVAHHLGYDEEWIEREEWRRGKWL